MTWKTHAPLAAVADGTDFVIPSGKSIEVIAPFDSATAGSQTTIRTDDGRVAKVSTRALAASAKRDDQS